MTQLRITVRNTSEIGGTFLTPTYFGFHDGSFNLFDAGSAASPGLESLAEDGAAATLATERVAADADSQGIVVAGAGGPIATQEITSAIIDVDGASNGFVNYAAMILPSNDAFIGNDESLKVFSASGRFLGEQTVVIEGSDVYDAGTEVNTELDAAFINQTGPNTGVDENGVVRLHPGFNGSEGNPLGDEGTGEGDQIILGGTNAFGEFIDPVEADFTREGAQIAEIHINTVVERTGTDGRDFIFGRRDDDLIDAGGGNDIISGGRGWDVIDGGEGNDWIAGGRGADVIAGGAGFDFIRGGRGDDQFLFSSGDDYDVIKDFNQRGDDQLVLNVDGIESFDDVLSNAHDTRFGVKLDLGDGDGILLRRVDLDELSESDFLFV
ncbi:MAG: spondin domain-containing protein [Pseudomonadota bacterium]